jgi:hypothetical protein
MHGLLLGAFVGLGFQVVEDLTYEANSGLMSTQGQAWDAVLVGIARLVTGITSHWMLTGIAGIGIVLSVARQNWSWQRRVVVFGAFYLLGCAMHFAWDAPDKSNVGMTSIAFRTVLYVLLFAVVYAGVLRTERQWFRATIALPAAQLIAPAPELHSLISRRARRRARKAAHVHGRGNRRDQLRRQRLLLDQIQDLGVRTDRVDTPPDPMRMLGP